MAWRWGMGLSSLLCCMFNLAGETWLGMDVSFKDGLMGPRGKTISERTPANEAARK